MIRQHHTLAKRIEKNEGKEKKRIEAQSSLLCTHTLNHREKNVDVYLVLPCKMVLYQWKK